MGFELKFIILKVPDMYEYKIQLYFNILAPSFLSKVLYLIFKNVAKQWLCSKLIMCGT